MAGPFPGMDPWLEHSELWPGVHALLISELHRALNASIRPRYVARVEQRIVIEEEDEDAIHEKHAIPDIRIAKASRRRMPAANGGAADAAPVVAVTMLFDERPERFIEIRDRESRAVVTVIELLSPSNKRRGSSSHAVYVAKRESVMNSATHLVEIDLLRDGDPIPVQGEDFEPADYLVHVSAYGDRPQGRLWPIAMHERLPVVAIPLRGKEEVALDLQACFDTLYDSAGYDLDVNYRADAEPPIPEELVEWADGLLRARKLR